MSGGEWGDSLWQLGGLTVRSHRSFEDLAFQMRLLDKAAFIQRLSRILILPNQRANRRRTGPFFVGHAKKNGQSCSRMATGLRRCNCSGPDVQIERSKQKTLGQALGHGGQQSSCYVVTWIWGIHYGEYYGTLSCLSGHGMYY